MQTHKNYPINMIWAAQFWLELYKRVAVSSFINISLLPISKEKNLQKSCAEEGLR